MHRMTVYIFLLPGLSVLSLPCTGQERPAHSGEADVLGEQIEKLRLELADQKKEYDARLEELKARLDKILEADQLEAEAPEDDLSALLDQIRTGEPGEETRFDFGGLGRAFQSMNPDISVIIDTYYHNDDSREGIAHVMEEMAGFGHSHGDGHEHAHVEDGFNMRHLGLHFSGEVDPYFKAWAIGAISEEGAEMEEAVIQTTSLPAGLQIKAGKFFSDFGRMNAQHSHQWDFVDQPLVYKLLFGDHGLNEKGAQLSWLAPTRHHLLFGLEALQGENELLANNIGGDHLPRREGPRLWVEWVKFSPNLGNEHGLQLGTFYGHGAHQEAHDADDNGVMDHWLNGHSGFWGASAVYKYDVAKPHGEGDILLQTEYVMRKKNLTVKDHDLSPAMIGRDRTDQQDGFYAQGLYGFLPRWRAGVRWDHVGLTNKGELPDGTVERFGDSARYAAMIDFSPTEFSRLRLQVSKGDYATSDGREDVVEVFLQFVISLGTHGAHKF